MDLIELLEFARSVTSDLSSTDDLLPVIEKYSLEIDNWVVKNSERLQGEIDPEEKELLAQLFAIHEEIVDQTALLMGETSEAIKKFKERSKAIKAYAGVTSERISVYRPKKG